MNLPNDPIMLLSVVNLKLRDFYKDLDALCDYMDADKGRPVRKAESCGLRVRRPAQPVRVIFPPKAFSKLRTTGTGAQRLCPGR